ncbi:uncharacterized protein LOC128168746 isoform X1 [Crassostrea angulata]|uniref:uncharacterized protein LOC128168746 isoform X1 n=1 Tax=Magallana angulata TaxID=2784310 RepID=UPI0022B0DFF1|nr:uncharacterized protein LOC128168746 isoform X1 [Crassostrea angulata]
MHVTRQKFTLFNCCILISFATTVARNYCVKRLVNGIIRCCTGFIWNNTIGDCIGTKACPLGYVGLQCEIPCVYPLYGLECQSVCNCSREFCLISTGCTKYVTSTEHYKTSSHTERQTDLTTLVTYEKLTTTDSFSPILYHTSKRSLFTESHDLSPNQESFPSVTIAVSMGCLILIIFFLTLLVCLLYRRHKRLREYVDENRYLSCAFKHTNDLGRKNLSSIDDGEIKIALTIFQKKKESVIHLEPHTVSQSSNQNVSHYSYVLPSRINPENPGSRTSLISIESEAYVTPSDRYSSKAESGSGEESNIYLTVLND